MSEPTLPTSGLPTQPTSNESATPAAQPGPMPSRIGRYTILGIVGEGGMGTVYEARQDAPDRVVALKVIRAGFLSPKLLRRFEHESLILGRLHHPGIAQVFEAGTVEDEHGRTVPFFAMEFVRGVDLTTHARTRDLSTRQRLDLMARICDAVDHAHAKGVIHRDLKPSNILIDESGHPKILDFGVARATDSDIAQTTMHTDIGQLIGTVPYMSPEQVAGDSDSLDTRSDVYALGVIAYELLAGRLPYDLERRMIHEAVRVIREVEPSRLSLADRTLRGDIETIVAKALEKEPARRYPSADALASDIRRYLRNEPITARPASTWYQLSKFARRNRALVAGVIAAFLILLAGIAATSWQAIAATRARNDAQANLARAEQAEADAQSRADELQQVADFQVQMLGQIDTTAAGVELVEDVRARFEAALEKAGVSVAERDSQSDTLRSLLARVNATDTAAAMIDRTILQPAIAAIDEQFKDQPVVDAQLRQALSDVYRSIGLYDAAYPLQESALATRRRVLGEEHPDTLTSLYNLVTLLLKERSFEEAESLALECERGNRSTFGPDHAETRDAVTALVKLYTAWHAAEPGKGYDAKAAQWQATLDAASEPSPPN